MFWGLILKANRKYSQTTSKSFHISQAALDSTSSAGGPTQIFLSYEEQKFLICTLHKDKCEQVSLDLNFAEGDEISFQSQGSGNVTLSGYLIDQDPMGFMGEDEEEEEESDVEADEVEDARVELDKKAKKKEKTGKASTAVAVEEDDEDEDDSDFNVEAALDGVKESDDEDDEEDEDDEDEDEDEEDDDEEQEDAESDDEEVQQPKAKQPKIEKPHKQQNGVAKETVEQKTKKDKKNKKEKKEAKPQQQQPQPQKQGGEKTLSGGVKIEDIRVGNGPEAKTGKRTTVYYEGRLKSNNKVFDSLKQGAGFKFGLGRGEVIKGWDIGVAGMKVGGKRRITCPPHMAYGARGSPPTIPPNSTLVFEVELKGVN